MVDLGVGAIELHHCQGLQRHKELSNNNKGTMARKEGSKGGKRAELSHCGHPTIPWSRGDTQYPPAVLSKQLV